MDYCLHFLCTALYDSMHQLEFPVSNGNCPTIKRLKMNVLDSKLERLTQTIELVEAAKATRRAVKFKKSLTSEFRWLFVGDHGGYCS